MICYRLPGGIASEFSERRLFGVCPECGQEFDVTLEELAQKGADELLCDECEARSRAREKGTCSHE